MDFLDEVEAAVPVLRRYARALTRDIDRADDLVQDAIERAIRKRALWRQTGPVRAWLFTILLNLHRNARRGERRRGDIALDDMPAEPAIAAAQPGHLALAEVERALARLPDEQREALLLVVLEGASYAEAARILDIPAGTLMSRLGRARASLRVLTGNTDGPRLRTIK